MSGLDGEVRLMSPIELDTRNCPRIWRVVDQRRSLIAPVLPDPFTLASFFASSGRVIP